MRQPVIRRLAVVILVTVLLGTWCTGVGWGLLQYLPAERSPLWGCFLLGAVVTVACGLILMAVVIAIVDPLFWLSREVVRWVLGKEVQK